MAKWSSFQENWALNSNTYDNMYTGYFGTTSISSNQCNYTVASGAGNYQGFDTVSSYDLTDSYFMMKLVNAGNQSLASLEVFLCQLFLDSSNSISWRINQNTIYSRYKVGGVTTDNASFSYVSGTHVWFRIRELNQVIYWDWSTDAVNWTNNYSKTVASLFAVSSLKLELAAGTFSNEGSGTTVITGPMNYFDKNLPFYYSKQGFQ